MHTSSAALRERNRALMHPRNRYKERPPDFAALARIDAAFARMLRPGGGLDWSNPQAAVELCRVLLWHDFGVRWEMPAHHLCPTLPSCLNYLLWLEDLIGAQDGKTVLGVDIGTGASGIYPLLGHAHLGWRFIATEIDPDSVAAARHNVALNGWEEHIEVRAVEVRSVDDPEARAVTNPPPASPLGAAPMLQHVLRPEERPAFCMCNPPFYDEGDRPPGPAPQHAPCAASRAEQFTPGGEVGFVLRLVQESQQLGTQVGWYSSLLGRKVPRTPPLTQAQAQAQAHAQAQAQAQAQTGPIPPMARRRSPVARRRPASALALRGSRSEHRRSEQGALVLCDRRHCAPCSAHCARRAPRACAARSCAKE